MKRLFRFAIFLAIVTGAFHLVRTHDQAIPLTEQQISLLDAGHLVAEIEKSQDALYTDLRKI